MASAADPPPELDAAPVPVLKRAPKKDPLRGSVTDKADAVWALRRRDLYTLKKKEETKDPEVDHILEIQFLRLALDRAGAPAAAELKHLYRVANDCANLNVTSHLLNQKKKGPFTRWCNYHKKPTARSLSLEQFAKTSMAGYDRFMKHWPLIEGAITHAYDDMLTALHADLQPASMPVVASFCDTLPAMFDALGVDK